MNKTESTSFEPMQLRTSNIKKLSTESFDVLIVGGGINGAVSAAALANKGVKTALIDQGDFACLTSQESSNLAWGGIKYLENLEFRLVHKLCKSRNHLIQHYPFTVKEIRFFTTIAKGFRFPPFFIWIGTWLYWLIGNCFTKPPRYLTKQRIQKEEPIVNTSSAQGGFEYSDAYLPDNDARFVFSFIRTALSGGCTAANYIKLVQSERENGQWVSALEDTITCELFTVNSKVIINSTGPLVDSFNENIGQDTEHKIVLSKGIHLLVDKVTESKKVLTFFASDGRLFFVIPMGSRTCIGTTDTPVDSPTKKVTEEDRKFVLDNINALLNFDKPLVKSNIIAERCGVRPLVVSGNGNGTSDWMQLSRKHVVEVNEPERYLTIFGGKLTDCLNVGEEVCEIVERMDIDIPQKDTIWYGEPDSETLNLFMDRAARIGLDDLKPKELTEPLSTRLWRRYGKAAFLMLDKIQADPQQAKVIIEGTEFLRCEIEEAAQHEMITKLSDFLRRRSKIALTIHRDDLKKSAGLIQACEILFGSDAEQKLEEYFQETASEDIV